MRIISFTCWSEATNFGHSSFASFGTREATSKLCTGETVTVDGRAGKSELLQSLVASLAVSNRPDGMTFVLVTHDQDEALAMASRIGVMRDGVLEQIAVLEALGRQLAAVPYLESAVLAAGVLAKFGSA